MMARLVFPFYGFIIVSTIAITVQLDHVSVSSINGSQISKVKQDLQYVSILNVTDDLNPELTTMSKPLVRSKRFNIKGDRWRSNNLTYRIINYPDTLSKADVDLSLARAFNLWTTYTYLTFTPKNTGAVHIKILFVKGNHGDGRPFDGPGRILAHAFFPPARVEIHFDADENWTFDSPYGRNLFQSAFHEMGHALGLEHSKIPTAIMTPYYNPYKIDLQLDFDDISGIQALYGIKAKPEKGSDKLCKDIKIDAIFNSNFGKRIIFKDEFYFLRNETSLDDDYVRFISQGWPELPGNIDAAFLHKNRKTFFFKGHKYWRYSGRKIDVGFPKSISEDFKGVPANLDAALYRKYQNEIYFFKDQFYWIYSFSTSIASNAKSIAELGLPSNLNAAFEHDAYGDAYFFQNENYYRISNISTHVRASDLYPPSSTREWFSCAKSVVVSNKKTSGLVPAVAHGNKDNKDNSGFFSVVGNICNFFLGIIHSIFIFIKKVFTTLIYPFSLLNPF